MIICSYNHSKYMNVLCVCVGGGEKFCISNLKATGIHSYQRALRG